MADPAAVRVQLETTPKKTFATAVDWPGWSRSGKTPEAAIEALLAYRDRYATAIAASGEEPPTRPIAAVLDTVEGDGATAYGVPIRIARADREPLDAGEADRRAAIVEAAWRTFDRVADAAPAELRKGPRGGGRDTPKIVEHVVGADGGSYSRELGLRMAPPDPTDRREVHALREAMLGVLRQPSDGSPVTKRWTTRYAAMRIAWHALDHAWEIEDRSEP
jgi:hypothetical protein